MIELVHPPVRRGNAPLRIARGHFATINTGSMAVIWLLAKIKPPFSGIFSKPYTFVLNTNQTKNLAMGRKTLYMAFCLSGS